MWHSGDEDGFQSQRFGVQIQVSVKKQKKDGGLGLGIGLGKGIGGDDRVRNWDRVRGGGERVTLFEKHPPPPKKSGKIT